MTPKSTVFQDLYAGRRASVAVSIDAKATSANLKDSHKRKVRSGVYLMTTNDCRTIIDEIAGHWGSSENLLRALDRDGVGRPWFRWSRPVARWMRRSEPMFIADAVIAGPAN